MNFLLFEMITLYLFYLADAGSRLSIADNLKLLGKKRLWLWDALIQGREEPLNSVPGLSERLISAVVGNLEKSLFFRRKLIAKYNTTKAP